MVICLSSIGLPHRFQVVKPGQTQPGGKGLLPFGADLAQRYMAIARDLRLSNTDHVRHLPTAVDRHKVVGRLMAARGE